MHESCDEASGIALGNLARFRHGGIEFDQRDGIGSVPHVLKVSYMGFVVMMRPSIFLSLTPALDAPSEGIADHIRGGGSVSMGFLEIDLEEEGDHFRIRSHEGRHRTRAILDLVGDGEIPVAFLLRSGDRASDVLNEHLVRLASGAHGERRQGSPGKFVPGPLFERVFISGEDGPEERFVSDLTTSPRGP